MSNKALPRRLNVVKKQSRVAEGRNLDLTTLKYSAKVSEISSYFKMKSIQSFLVSEAI